MFSLLCCFLEYLHFNGIKVSQMANYLSAIKSTFTIYGMDVSCFTDQRLKLYQRAVQLHAPLSVKLNKVIDIALLKQIVQQCDLTYMGQIFKAVYLLSFFSFLRLSNLVPHCARDQMHYQMFLHQLLKVRTCLYFRSSQILTGYHLLTPSSEDILLRFCLNLIY